MMNVFNGYKKIVSFSSKGMYSAAFKKLMDASNNVIAAPTRGKRKRNVHFRLLDNVVLSAEVYVNLFVKAVIRLL